MSDCSCKYLGEANCDLHRGNAGIRHSMFEASKAARSSTMLPAYLLERIHRKLCAKVCIEKDGHALWGNDNWLQRDAVTKEQLLEFYDDIKGLLP